jgi:hypothetical protein
MEIEKLLGNQSGGLAVHGSLGVDAAKWPTYHKLHRRFARLGGRELPLFRAQRAEFGDLF